MAYKSLNTLAMKRMKTVFIALVGFLGARTPQTYTELDTHPTQNQSTLQRFGLGRANRVSVMQSKKQTIKQKRDIAAKRIASSDADDINASLMNSPNANKLEVRDFADYFDHQQTALIDTRCSQIVWLFRKVRQIVSFRRAAGLLRSHAIVNHGQFLLLISVGYQLYPVVFHSAAFNVLGHPLAIARVA